MLFKEFFNESCDDLMLETFNVTYTLQQHKDQELVGLIKQNVTERLQGLPYFAAGVGKKMLDRYTNFFTYTVLQDQSWLQYLEKSLTDQQNPRFKLGPTENKKDAVTRIGGSIRNMWRDWGDYFMAMGNTGGNVFKKLNSISYTPQIINQEVEDWHNDLAARKRGMPNQEVKTILTLDHLGGKWKGWKWVDLETNDCPEEAEAMGHCGTSAEGDNLLSLRDPEGYAHLTFAVNDKMLGQSKGRANSKPSSKYHDAIVELLKSDYIHTIMGGGYDPHNNFNFNDLHEKKQKKLEHKKYINDPVGYTFDHYKGENLVGAMNELFNTNYFEKFDGENFVLNTFENFEEIEDAAKYWEGKVENLKWFDESWQNFEGVNWQHDIEDLVSKLDKENLATLERYFKKERPKDHEELKWEELIEDNEEIKDHLIRAADYTQEVAVLDEAYKNIKKQLSEGGENGFSIDFKTHPWRLIILKDNLRSLYEEMQRDDTLDDDAIHSYIKITYSAPYYGYDGHGLFDDAYFNERFAEDMPPQLTAV